MVKTVQKCIYFSTSGPPPENRKVLCFLRNTGIDPIRNTGIDPNQEAIVPLKGSNCLSRKVRTAL